MQRNGVAQAPPLGGGGAFQARNPRAEGALQLYFYAVSMDGVRYRVTLRKPLGRHDPTANLLRMKEEDFFSVSREGNPIPTAVFISAYSRFFNMARPGPPHTLEIFYSSAGP